MRKVLFAIVFAAAAFAGGMLFNNKEALSRVRGWIGPRPPSVVETVDKPIEEKDAKDAKDAKDSAEPLVSKSTIDLASTETDDSRASAIPAAPLPPLSLGGSAAEDSAAKSTEKTHSRPKAKKPVADKKRELASSSPPDAPGALDASALTATEPAADPKEESPPLESPADSKSIDPEVRRARDSADEPKPKTESKESTSAGAPTADWLIVRTRMKRFGVTRYWLEGEPDGRCRFHCFVPLADGSQTVGRQFEAEAADPLKAADSALRRIALWKATEEE